MSTPTNAARTKTFFKVTDSTVKNEILDSIAAHYDITRAEALDEVTGEEAESLLDYLTGPVRAAAHLLMRRHNLA